MNNIMDSKERQCNCVKFDDIKTFVDKRTIEAPPT